MTEKLVLKKWMKRWVCLQFWTAFCNIFLESIKNEIERLGGRFEIKKTVEAVDPEAKEPVPGSEENQENEEVILLSNFGLWNFELRMCRAVTRRLRSETIDDTNLR